LERWVWRVGALGLAGWSLGSTGWSLGLAGWSLMSVGRSIGLAGWSLGGGGRLELGFGGL